MLCLRNKVAIFATALLLLCVILPAFAQVPASSHVILVIEENRSYSTVTNSGDSTNFMPWLINEGNTYGHATAYTTDSGGSLLDYLWLSSGSCHANSTDCSPSSLPAGTNNFGCNGGGCANTITDDNIFRELNSRGISWKLYAESLPSVGFMGSASSDGLYVKRHNPAAWYSDIVNSATQQQKMVPFTQFATDLANNTLPQYSIIVPNLQHDAHDGTPAAADAWLQSNVAPVLNQSYFQTGGTGLLLITFDNGDGDVPGQVYTAVIGPTVVKGTASSTPYKHENALRTILDALQVSTHPGASANVSAMNDFFCGTCTPPPPPSGGDANLDDNTWTPAASATNVTAPALDGASTRFDFTSTVPFDTQRWTQQTTNTFAGNSQLAMDVWVYLTNSSAPQALNFNAHQIVNGQEYPFMLECDFKGTGVWRVWNPGTGGWTNSTLGCAAFTANSWNHFVFHFERTAGNQLHYQDIVINGTTYNLDLFTNSIANTSANSMTAEIHLVGDSVPDPYSIWIDQMRIMAVSANIDDGSWAPCASPLCSPAVNNVASPSQDGGSTQFTAGGTTTFQTAQWSTTPSGMNTSATQFTLDFWAYMNNPTVSQALNFQVNQVTGGHQYPFMVECDFKATKLWRVWDPGTGGWQNTSIGCAVFTANSWNHFTFRFERTSDNRLHYRDMVINNAVYNFDIFKSSIANSGAASVTMKIELVEDGVPDSYSLWIDKLSLGDI